MSRTVEGEAGAAMSLRVLMLLWLVVIVEAVMPVPFVLTVGAGWVLLARPPWFLGLVRRLYAGRGTA